jgi:hypothetical protein
MLYLSSPFPMPFAEMPGRAKSTLCRVSQSVNRITDIAKWVSEIYFDIVSSWLLQTWPINLKKFEA